MIPVGRHRLTYYIPILDGAILPEQLGSQRQGKIIGENTGMIACPMKRAGIAVECCLMYQKELNCGEGCPAKPKRAEARAVREAKKERGPRGKYDLV